MADIQSGSTGSSLSRPTCHTGLRWPPSTPFSELVLNRIATLSYSVLAERRQTSSPRDKRANCSIGKHYVPMRRQNGSGGVIYANSKVIQAKSIRRTAVGKRIG
ncbi:hypothetical protein J6590_074261 [Homalodisca vitripennis]|nr:hypothetical protein J6590_074261 [Homalodisca vitripennis]